MQKIRRRVGARWQQFCASKTCSTHWQVTTEGKKHSTTSELSRDTSRCTARAPEDSVGSMRGKWIAGIVLLLCLSGCSAEVGDESQASSATGSPTPSASQVEPGPPKETPVEQDQESTPAPEVPGSPIEATPGESEYLQAVGTSWNGDVPEAEQLLALGSEVCVLLGDGTPLADIQVVDEGHEFREANNDAVRFAALHMLCPDLVQS